jgi:hypothetical protein
MIFFIVFVFVLILFLFKSVLVSLKLVVKLRGKHELFCVCDLLAMLYEVVFV